MNRLPYFPFYPGDWLRGEISGLGLDAQGLWIRLLCVMHDADPCGSLEIGDEPMSSEFLANKCGINVKKVEKLLQKLEQIGVAKRNENGAIYSDRMIKAERERQQNTERQKRFYDRQKAKPNGDSNGDLTEDSHSSSSSSSSSNSNSYSYSNSIKKDESCDSSRKKGSRIRDDFSVTPEMIEWAIKECPGVSYTTETEKFVNYYTAKTGKDATKLDWAATWRNWMLNARDRYGSNSNSNWNDSRKATPGERIRNRRYR